MYGEISPAHTVACKSLDWISEGVSEADAIRINRGWQSVSQSGGLKEGSGFKCNDIDLYKPPLRKAMGDSAGLSHLPAIFTFLFCSCFFPVSYI